MPEQDDSVKPILPPYLAFQSFKNFIKGLRETGLPARIDKSVLGSMSGATQSSLILTLKFLRLISADGTPSPELVQLVDGGEAGEKKVYAGLIAQRYAFVAERKVSLETATQSQLEEVFTAKDLTGETLRKAVSFFVLLSTEAGMKVGPHLKSAKRRGNGSGVRRQKKRNGDEGVGGGSGPAVPPPPPTEPSGHKSYALDLSADGKRIIKVTAPIDLKSDEIERLSGWLHFQYNVEWKKKS